MIWLSILLAVLVYPDGSPWGHAGMPDGDTCASCHWDDEAEIASPRLQIDGLPAHFTPGARYELTIRLEAAGAMNGFQLAASAGEFVSVAPDTQSQAHAVRSVAPAGVWRVDWLAPASPTRVQFWLAVNDANGDASEFGDRILLHEFESGP